MFITPQILSIPPHLSTTWKNIVSLHAIPSQTEVNSFNLVVILSNRMRVIVPKLTQADISKVFEAHARFTSPTPALSLPLSDNTNPLPPFASSMQHNSSEADAPELPKEILGKIGGIAKVLGMNDLSELPKPEPHCNCPFCQIMKAFHSPEAETLPLIDQEVSEEDLAFRTWDIKQTAEKLYTVSNPIDESEHYSVYLGEPLGCTCGQKNCEHIHAVLKT